MNSLANNLQTTKGNISDIMRELESSKALTACLENIFLLIINFLHAL